MEWIQSSRVVAAIVLAVGTFAVAGPRACEAGCVPALTTTSIPPLQVTVEAPASPNRDHGQPVVDDYGKMPKSLRRNHKFSFRHHRVPIAIHDLERHTRPWAVALVHSFTSLATIPTAANTLSMSLRC